MKSEVIVVGGGCFWCLEAIYQRVAGISRIVSGYAGGETNNPSYDEVCSGATGHAEVVELTFDSSVINLEQILEIFWLAHNPTSRNRQGNDVGTQYRSVTYFTHPKQEMVIRAAMETAQKSGLYVGEFITEISALKQFYKAEAYHQNYFATHKEAPYCELIIGPKLEKLQKYFRRQPNLL